MYPTPVNPKFGHTGTPRLPDGKDHKHLPPPPLSPRQLQAPPLGDVPAEPSPTGVAGSRLRDRVRRRGEPEAGEAPILSHKRAKAQVDYARMDGGSSNDEDEGSPSAREDIKSSSGARPARASKRKDRKSEDSDYEVERESSEPTKAANPIKRRKAARPTATPLTMDASQPVAELRRLLGLRPGWDGAPQGGSSSSSAPAQLSVAQMGALAAAQAAAREFEPAIDAQTLSQTLREAFAKNARGLGKLCAALGEIVPSLRHLPPAAFEVATRAIGQLTAYRPAASEHVATHLCEWCASLGDQAATFARLLIDEMGDRIYQGAKGKKQRQTVVDDLLSRAPSPATAGVWQAVLSDSLAHDDVDGLDRLVLRVVEHGKDSALAQQFFQCLGTVCRDHAVPADRLCELVGPLVGTQARASNGEDAATRTAYLRAGFASFCEGLWAQGLDRAQHNALVEQWLSPREPEKLLARQRVMGPELVKRRPPPNFSKFVESTRTKVPDFRKYTSLVMGTFAHLLDAAKADPAEREAIAQVLPRCLDLLLETFTPDECAEVLRQASAELMTVGDRETFSAFFGELLSQIHLRGMLAPGGGGQALLVAALERPTSGPQSSLRTDSYFNALVDFSVGMPEPMLKRLAQLGAENSNRSLAPLKVQKEGHVLLQWIFKKCASTPGLSMVPLVEGFIGGMVGRLDLEQRLARFVNGLADGLTAEDGAAARTVGHAVAVGLGGAAISAESMDACMTALAPRLRLLAAECVTDFVEGLVSGLGGASLPLERVRQITRALNETRAQTGGEPHTNENQARVTLRAELGALRFNQALAVTQRPWDLPGAAGAPPVSLLTEASTRIAALRAAIDALGAAPAARPPLSEVCAHDREAARLWLALEGERRALLTSAAPSELAAMQAQLEEALAQLQAHLPPPQAGLTPEAVAQRVKQFQRRDTTGLDSAAQTHDALVLGWRLGLGREGDGAQPLARAGLAERTHRLFQLAAPPATGAGTDPIVTGLLQAAIRPRNAMAANAALLRPLLEHALDTAAVREAPPDRAARLALLTRIATTVEWTLRSATALGKPDEVAAWSAQHLWLHPGERLASQWADGTEQPRLMASCVARAVDARNHDAALEQLVVHASQVSVTAAHALGRGLAEAIGRGEPLQRALRFAAALPEARESFEYLVTGLCHHEAAADVLFKAARDFSPAQKVALLRHTHAFTGIRRSFALHLAAPPPEGHPRHCGEPALTIRETRDWALAWAVAGKAAQVPDLGALKAEFNRPVPPASLPGASGPAVVAPAEDAARKKVCQEAVQFVKEPYYLIRQMGASDMSGPQRLAWLDILYGDKERMTAQFSRRELTSLIGLPQGSLTQAERALRIECVLTLVRHGADHLQGIDLRGARNFMLEQLRAMQEDITSLDDGQPSIDHTELYLRTSQAITALYTPAIFGRAINLQWVFQPPANDAPQAQTEAFLAKVRDHVDDIHLTLDALVSDIDDMQTRMDRATRRTDNEKALLALRQGLAGLTPPPAQAPAWLATLDMTVLNLQRATLLPETLGQLRAAMGGLVSTLQAVVRMATEGSAPPAPGILNSPVQQEPEVEGLG